MKVVLGSRGLGMDCEDKKIGTLGEMKQIFGFNFEGMCKKKVLD